MPVTSTFLELHSGKPRGALKHEKFFSSNFLPDFLTLFWNRSGRPSLISH